MDANAARSLVNELFEIACIELFESLNCTVRPAEANEDLLEPDPFSSIDAGSDEMELQIFLKIPISVLSLSYPVTNIIEIDEENLEDWLAELANQLMGRLKSKLIKYGSDIQLGLPESYFDVPLRTFREFNGNEKAFYFLVDNELACCTLCQDIFYDTVSLSMESDGTDKPDEGELELF